MKAHTITPDDTVTDFEMNGFDAALLKTKVEGDIELVSVIYNDVPATMIVNEIGAVTDTAINPVGLLPPNARATAIYWHATAISRTPCAFDPLHMPMIYGNVVLLEISKREL